MSQSEKDFLFSNLNLQFIPQVSLLSGNRNTFKLVIDIFLKKIVCRKQECTDENLCHNCQKLAENTYFDLNWYKLNKTNTLKKQDAMTIINTLLHQSLEANNPRICIIENIEHSSLEASNIFLKFLENLLENVFLIFASDNSEKILPTIQSRCQIINLNNFELSVTNKNLNLENDSNLAKIKEFVEKFITYDNNKDYNSNFFLIKELLTLEAKIILFFQFLLKLAQRKLINISLNGSNKTSLNNEDQVVNDLVANWKNNNQLFLIKLIELLNEVINKFSNTKNLNLNLLLNYFFIILYQG